MVSNLPVKADRIACDINDLAAITETDRPWTRRVFTPLYLEGRSYVEKRMLAAGLETRIDAAGNLIGFRKGLGEKGVIMLGSHTDTVPNGGRFDGVAGVVAALEVARSLHDNNIELQHDLEIVDFLAEEVSPFGASCIGSRGMTGQLPRAWLDRVNAGRTLHEELGGVGGNGDIVLEHRRADLKAFLELHIEQGPVLEDERKDIGLVTTIVGISRFEIIIEGRADHAGTTPMTKRADALVAAAKLTLEIRQRATEISSEGGHFTATVGEFSIEPNAANVVPSSARLLIDARAELRTDMDGFTAWLDLLCAQLSRDYAVSIPAVNRVSDNDPAPSDLMVLEHLERACGTVGATHRRIASGAGHDAAWLSKVTPTAMIFVPSKGGRSHTPDEWTSIGEITLGAAVLYEAVLSLDETLSNKQ